MTREDWKQYEAIQSKADVLLAMRARCTEQGHEFEPCLTATFRYYQECKWCKERKP